MKARNANKALVGLIEAVKRRPGKLITLRQKARVIKKSL